MKLFFHVMSGLLLLASASCTATLNRKVDAASGNPQNAGMRQSDQKAVPGPVIQKIEYDENDPLRHKKQEIDALLSGLAAPSWKERESNQNKLLELALASDKNTIRHLVIRSRDQRDPEINFRAKKVLLDYFLKSEYDPNRKKGFLGLQLLSHGPLVVGGEQYVPIQVVMPQEGFPGKAAGIEQGDLILGVDGKICGRNFTLNDFILYIASQEPGKEINLVLFSGNNLISKKVKLGARPDNLEPPAPQKSQNELFDAWYKNQLNEVQQSKPEYE